ncbi:MAG: PAC2 family protein [Candidatus Hydrogenedentes bacterium]|nr:PAC2 family protein [Candidatus Hydrogenedentota bacterium]
MMGFTQPGGLAGIAKGRVPMESGSLRIDELPDLQNARMLMGFSGWMDGGEVSTGTIDYLVKALDAVPFGEILPEDFYIYNFPGSMELAALFRPHARIENGLVRVFQEPTNTFYYAAAENLVLFRGKEPNIRWREYAEHVFSVAQEVNVKEMYYIGSVGGLVPHTRDPVFWTSMTDEDLREVLVEAGFSPTNYEGPSSFSTYLITRAMDRGLRMASCVAGIPSYVDGRNVKCIQEITRKLATILGLTLDFSGLEAETAEFLANLDKVVKENSRLNEKVRQLEKFYDEEVGPTSGDDVRAWFERQDLEID